MAGASWSSPATIRSEIAERFGYDLSESVDQIRAWYGFEISCRGTVPPAIVCALEASGYEDAIRNAVSLGGDADTLACITGDVAEALYGLPRPIDEETRRHLDDGMLKVTEQLYQQVSRRA